MENTTRVEIEPADGEIAPAVPAKAAPKAPQAEEAAVVEATEDIAPEAETAPPEGEEAPPETGEAAESPEAAAETAETPPAETAEADPADGDAETPLETETPPEQAAEREAAPRRLPDEVEQELALKREADQLINEDPEFQKSYLKALKRRRGGLTPDAEQRLAELEGRAAPAGAPSAPGVKTDEEVQAEARKLYDLDKPAEAAALIARHENDKIRREIAAENLKRLQAEQRQQQSVQQAEAQRAVRANFAEAAKTFPGLFKADPNAAAGYVITDKVVREEMYRASQKLGAVDVSVSELAELALMRTGKHATFKRAAPKVLPTPKAEAPRAGKPVSKPAGKPVAARPAGGVKAPANDVTRIEISN